MPRVASRRIADRRGKLRRRYGLTVAEWDKMEAEQHGTCAICGEPPTGRRNLHVDHCHDTGAIRGLLCIRCNTSLAWFERVANRLDRVKRYLAKRRKRK